MARKTVGISSDRSPGKHRMLDRFLGAVAGSLSRPSMEWLSQHPIVFLDLCAGDGAANDHSGTSSAEILLKHANWLRKRGFQVHVIFVEKTLATYDLLKIAVKSLGFDEQHDQVILGDSRLPGVVPTVWTDGSAIFVHNDPNTVHDFALSDDLVARLPRHTTTLSTLGCNAGGIKRMEREERMQWYEHIRRVTLRMPRYHDAYLVALDGDASQFAWLITGPIKWRVSYESGVQTAFRSSPFSLRGAWCRPETDEFKSIADYLFMIRKERQ